MDSQSDTIKIEGFDELQKKLTITLPKIIRSMAFTTDASVAALARKEEVEGASSLEMGKPQIKGSREVETYSSWDSSRGWVSTSKMTKEGPLKMGHFTWARGTRTRKGSVIAEYGNRLANLWARSTKPYTKKSPVVRQLGRPSKVWQAGEVRPAKYNWSITASIANSMATAAIAKTEKQFAKQIREM